MFFPQYIILQLVMNILILKTKPDETNNILTTDQKVSGLNPDGVT